MADTTDAFDELFTDPFQTEWLLNDPWQGAYDGEDERTSGTSHAHSLDIGMPPIEEVVTPTALNRSYSDPPPKLSRLNTADNPYQRLGIRWQPIRALSVGGQSESPAMSYIDGDGSLSPEEGVRSPTTSTSEVDGGRPNERSERRRAQNRKAQRNYRARQLERIKNSSVEAMLAKHEMVDLHEMNSTLLTENERLKVELQVACEQNAQLQNFQRRWLHGFGPDPGAQLGS